ncbi:MAG: DUF2726 domain-containing protein [Pseudomonadota bacterium]
MIWFGLMIAIVGYFIYRLDKKFKTKYEDKFNPKEWELPILGETIATTPIQTTPSTPIASAAIYEKKDSLLSHAEKLLFDALQSAVAADYCLLAKVSVTDVIEIKSANGGALPNPFSGKQFAFVVCEKNTLQILCAIAFNEKIQTQDIATLSDSPLTSICVKAKIPLLNISRQLKYDAQQLRAQIDREINVFEIKKMPPKILSATVTAANTTPTEPAIKTAPPNPCPKCSGVMVKRKTKNAELWVCIRYPECRGVLAVESNH